MRVQVDFVALRLHGLRRTHTSMAEAAKAEAAEAIKQRYAAVTAKAQELKDSFTNSEYVLSSFHACRTVRRALRSSDNS